MNCPKCANVMVLAKATNFGNTYQYCRTCKKELCEIEALGSGLQISIPKNSHVIVRLRAQAPAITYNNGIACRREGVGVQHFRRFAAPNCFCGSIEYDRDSGEWFGQDQAAA